MYKSMMEGQTGRQQDILREHHGAGDTDAGLQENDFHPAFQAIHCPGPARGFLEGN